MTTSFDAVIRKAKSPGDSSVKGTLYLYHWPLTFVCADWPSPEVTLREPSFASVLAQKEKVYSFPASRDASTVRVALLEFAFAA